MTVETRQTQRVTVLSVQGQMVLGDGDLALRRALEEALRDGAQNLLLNLSGLTFADSSGFGEMAASVKSVRDRGGRFAVCEARPSVRQVLGATGLDRAFEVFDTEAQALAALA